jgi:autotransporter-associated beta strand protein
MTLHVTVAAGAADEFPGWFDNGAALVKTGPGLMILSGANAANGTLTVSNGTMLVHSRWAGAAVVNSNATLSGCGTISGSVTVSNGATLVSGASATSNALAIGGNLALATNALLALSANSATGSAALAVSGTVALNGARLACTLGFTPRRSDRVCLVRNGSATAVSGTCAGMPEGAEIPLSRGTRARISYVGNADGGAVANDIVLFDFVPPFGAVMRVR